MTWPVAGDRVARRICVTGPVQGVGGRPAVAKLARELELVGDVANTPAGLRIVVSGDATAVQEFVDRLPEVLPSGGTIARLETEVEGANEAVEFVIRQDECSESDPIAVPVPVDRVVCRRCLDDVASELGRRFGYPLTTCTECGPRWTVIRSMPYERQRTSLAEFTMCRDCGREYADSGDRRYHAQTIGCPYCGPNVWGTDRHGRDSGTGLVAVERAVAVLRDGAILALRGVGGYQLLCDATDAAAVQTLRKRKLRLAKPLAVLVPSPSAALELATLSTAELHALTSAANPIVLCRARDNGRLAFGVYGLLAEVGVMLPSSPLHQLLADRFGGPLVCTSANREGEPLEYLIHEAVERLGHMIDFWLHHDRPIERPIDDSVVRVIADREVTIRLGRGLAPLPLPLPATMMSPTSPVARADLPVLAVGGHLKTAAAWCNGTQAVLGPHIGDQETLSARERYIAHLDDVQRLYRFTPQVWAHDEHPDYFTTQYAAGRPGRTMGIQHHLAHVAAGMLEHGLHGRRVLGIPWDGTGLGPDGTVWGGEFLLVEPDFEFRRVAHLRTFPLFGGDAAVREPLRVAIPILADSIGVEEIVRAPRPLAESNWLERTLRLALDPRFGVRSSSAGRLFDAAAALILGLRESRYDGEPAMRLEAIADPMEQGSYLVELRGTGPVELDWRPMFAALWRDLLRGESPPTMSARFHRGLAQAIVRVCRRSADLPIVPTGGVFQNRLLTELVVEQAQGSLDLRLPGRIPPNDGGLAAGQLVIALRRTSLRD